LKKIIIIFPIIIYIFGSLQTIQAENIVKKKESAIEFGFAFASQLFSSPQETIIAFGIYPNFYLGYKFEKYTRNINYFHQVEIAGFYWANWKELMFPDSPRNIENRSFQTIYRFAPKRKIHKKKNYFAYIGFTYGVFPLFFIRNENTDQEFFNKSVRNVIGFNSGWDFSLKNNWHIATSIDICAMIGIIWSISNIHSVKWQGIPIGVWLNFNYEAKYKFTNNWFINTRITVSNLVTFQISYNNYVDLYLFSMEPSITSSFGYIF
jgi:hypothetical protein